MNPHNYVEITLMDGTFYRVKNVQRIFLTDRMPFGEKALFGKEQSAYRAVIQFDAIMESDNEATPIGTWIIRAKQPPKMVYLENGNVEKNLHRRL